MRQKGFTLIELLVAMAISSILLSGILLSIYQIMWGTVRINSQVVALTDVNQAALAIKKDLQMTQSSNLSSTPQSSANLTWIDYTGWGAADNQTTHTSSYAFSYALSDTQLRRTYDGTESIAGRNITFLKFTKNGRVINVVITATSTGFLPRSETLEFSVYMRTEEAQ